VVVGYLYVLSIAFRPPEANSPLVVDSDAVLTLTIPSEPFKAIAGRDSKIPERLGAIEDDQLPQSLALKRRGELPGNFTAEDSLCLPVSEAPNHPAA
jgi:hypothetical protein